MPDSPKFYVQARKNDTVSLERGIPSKRESLARVDYVPALLVGCIRLRAGKFPKPNHLEEVKVVTRFP
ncbi:hypothetical protein T09_13171 [Trichinella sp. T9]|nr:hypothetical protein T09_13171 [Trichinella sp. T9]